MNPENIEYLSRYEEEFVPFEKLGPDEKHLKDYYLKTKTQLKDNPISIVNKNKMQEIANTPKSEKLPEANFNVQVDFASLSKYFLGKPVISNLKLKINVVYLGDYHLVNVIYTDDTILSTKPDSFMSFEVEPSGELRLPTGKRRPNEKSLKIRFRTMDFLMKYNNFVRPRYTDSKIIKIQEKIDSSDPQLIEVSIKFLEEIEFSKDFWNDPDINFSSAIDSSAFEKMPFKAMRFVLEGFGKAKYTSVIKEGPEIYFCMNRDDDFESASSILLCYVFNMDKEIFYYVEDDGLPFPKERKKEFDEVCQTTALFIAEIIKYINSPKSKIKKNKSRKNSSKGANSSSTNNVIYINKKEYIHEESKEETETREYNRHVKECSVRGHWRRYRNEEGEVVKKVWIKPYKKKFDEGEEKNNKVYKI